MSILDKVFRTIVKQGLRNDTENKKGVSFLVRDKSHFTLDGVKGFVCGSHQSLQLNANSSTHWTPNLYCYGTYTNTSRLYIKGFEESNLRQINCFVVDIDTKEYSTGEIILHAIDNDLGEPTLIVESDKGYHVYFALDKPVYISAKSNFKSLKIAKRISYNLKQCFKSIGADVYCNDFVFFRIPNEHNIKWFNEYNTFTFQRLMNWSQQYDDNNGRLFRVLQAGESNVSHTDWVIELLQNNYIKGSKGQLGRNNILFTLALSCMQDGKSQDDAFDILDQFNSNLANAVTTPEIIRIIQSAYSGKYEGASQQYIKEFYELYAGKEYKITPNRTVWYKFKKPRDERKNSHYDEWEKDIVKYLNKNVQGERYLTMSQNELCREIGISRSSLNELVKQSKMIIKKSIGKGRQATTQWTTVSILFRHAMNQLRETKSNYANYIDQFIVENLDDVVVNPAVHIIASYLMELRTDYAVNAPSG